MGSDGGKRCGCAAIVAQVQTRIGSLVGNEALQLASGYHGRAVLQDVDSSTAQDAEGLAQERPNATPSTKRVQDHIPRS
eukprot:3021145-Amphidinium_carterae.1